VLVGMPPRSLHSHLCCTNVHLPGYKGSFETLNTTCGVDKIAVVITNDRYVNDAWAKKGVGIVEVTKEAGGTTSTSTSTCTENDSIIMLSDGDDAELCRSLGLVEGNF
jgi:hypothetical protein